MNKFNGMYCLILYKELNKQMFNSKQNILKLKKLSTLEIYSLNCRALEHRDLI